jgi:hypothetical protein
MTKLFVKLQTPTIELVLSAKDASGQIDKLTVGFKRLEAEDASKKLLELQKIFQTQADSVEDIDTTAIDAFVVAHVAYFKKVNLVTIDDNDQQSSLSILDTRKAKPFAGRWETPEECLAALLDMYLASSPWRPAFNEGVQKALVNADMDEGKLKN